MKKLKVDPIKNGSVLDHIAAGKALKVLKILKLDKNNENELLIGMNLPSSRMDGKRKDIIKVENTYFSAQEVNSIALVSPNATLSIIKDYEIVDKQNIDIPTEVKEIIDCPNKNCITNIEHIPTNFQISHLDNGKVKVKCKYCEKVFDVNEVRMML